MPAHGNIEPFGAFLYEKRGPFLTILFFVLCVIHAPNFFPQHNNSNFYLLSTF